MPASTSDTTARLLCSSVDSIFSVPVVAFIGYPPCFALSERGCPPHHQKVIPQCGLVVNAGLLPLTGRWQGRVSARSAVLRVFVPSVAELALGYLIDLSRGISRVTADSLRSGVHPSAPLALPAWS